MNIFTWESTRKQAHPTRLEDMRACNMGAGPQISQCCGSQLVPSIKEDTINKGITVSVTDAAEEVANTNEYVVDYVQLPGCVVNVKLRITP